MIRLGSKGKRLVGALVLVALLVGVGVYLTFRYLVKPPPPAESVPPSVQLLESRLIGRKAGERQWEVLARSVLQAAGLITLSDMEKITMFQEGQPNLSIWADQAIWDKKKDVLDLEGSVVVEGEDEFRLQSDLLIWEGDPETLTSPGPVLINWKDQEIKAERMVLETRSNLLHLLDYVEIRQDGSLWRLQEVVYDLDQEVMDFYGVISFEAEVGGDEQG